MKRLLMLIIPFAVTVTNITAQSIHKYFWEKERNVKQNELSAFDVPEFIPENKKQTLSKTVFGFLPDWEYVSDSKRYLRFDRLTHVAVFGFTADDSGNLQNPLAWPWNDLISAAHSSGVKVIMTVISFDNETTHALLTDNNARNNLFDNIADVISQNGLDGVNLDFEGLYESDRGTTLNEFVAALKNDLNDTLEISFDSPAWNWGGWDFEGLANACDYLFVMEYDYFGAWSEQSGPSAPLTGNGINVTRSITEQYADVPSNKIILGVPYYGIHWVTENFAENSNAKNFLDYLTYRNIVSGFEWNSERWSENYNVPWFAWQEDSVHQIWYDDIESIALKYEFALERNLRGVGIWALGFDGRRTELWDLIDNKFGSGNIPRPEPPVTFAVRCKEMDGESFAELIFGTSRNADYYVVYKSLDGINFTDSVIVADTVVLFPRTFDGTEYYKVAAANEGGISLGSVTLALNAISCTDESMFLIVDGFDRYYGNNNNFNYIRKVASLFDSLNLAYVSANNEFVIKNGFENIKNVYWILGNESRTTETFNYKEQNFLKMLINKADAKAPVGLFVSGSEIGYDLTDADYSSFFDEEFYSHVLKAEYISDAPLNSPYTYYSVQGVEGSALGYSGTFNFDNGSGGTFNVGYPDAVKSAVSDSLNNLAFVGVPLENGAAGISYSGDNLRTVYFSFPLETVNDLPERYELFRESVNYLLGIVNNVEDEYEVHDFKLLQNYPNPFNPVTKIKYTISSSAGKRSNLQRNFSDIGQNKPTSVNSVAGNGNGAGVNVQLIVYDILGRKVATLVNSKQLAGEYEVTFNAGDLASGIYFYKLQCGNRVAVKKMILLK